MRAALTNGAEERSDRCLIEQADHIRSFALWLRGMYSWIEAGAYLLPGEGMPQPRRKFGQIVDDEIARTEELLTLYSGRGERFVHTAGVHGTLHGYSPRFLEQLSERIEVMKRHRNDTIVPIALGAKV